MKKKKTVNRRIKRRKSKSIMRFFNGLEHRQQLAAEIGLAVLLALLVMLALFKCASGKTGTSDLNIDASEPEIDVQLLDVNEYSRPGTESDPITGIVIHYTANPGSSAQENRDYFNSLKDGHGDYISSHFVVGLEGEIVQCVPTWEIAYASNERNHDTVSIECCHPDEGGEFTEETYISVVKLTAFLCNKYSLTEEDVIRHYDVTGKNCPKYFVENEEAWQVFKADVAEALQRTAQE